LAEKNSRAQREVNTQEADAGVTQRVGACDVDGLFTRTLLAVILEFLIGYNNARRDWSKNLGLYCMFCFYQ